MREYLDTSMHRECYLINVQLKAFIVSCVRYKEAVVFSWKSMPVRAIYVLYVLPIRNRRLFVRSRIYLRSITFPT